MRQEISTLYVKRMKVREFKVFMTSHLKIFIMISGQMLEKVRGFKVLTFISPI
jgi:hypothetical protein